MAKKGILVTGGSGLVGAYAVQMLLECGERPVIFDVALSERLLGAVGLDPAQLTLIRGDMLELPALISGLRDRDCDRVIHLPAALKATREIAIQQMIHAAVKGESTKISWPYGPAEILYGKDAAKGTVLAVLKDKFKDTLFHIGNGIMLSGDDIVAAVRKAYPG